MEAKMMMPANYCVMSEEEMTYTEARRNCRTGFLRLVCSFLWLV